METHRVEKKKKKKEKRISQHCPNKTFSFTDVQDSSLSSWSIKEPTVLDESLPFIRTPCTFFGSWLSWEDGKVLTGGVGASVTGKASRRFRWSLVTWWHWSPTHAPRETLAKYTRPGMRNTRKRAHALRKIYLALVQRVVGPAPYFLLLFSSSFLFVFGERLETPLHPANYYRRINRDLISMDRRYSDLFAISLTFQPLSEKIMRFSRCLEWSRYLEVI